MMVDEITKPIRKQTSIASRIGWRKSAFRVLYGERCFREAYKCAKPHFKGI